MEDWLTTATSCRIMTTGRRSGEPHTVTVWFAAVVSGAPSGSAVTVYAMSRDGLASHWVQNLRAEPAVMIAGGRRRRPGRARVVDDSAEHELARQTMYAKYAPRRRGLEGWLSADSATVVAVDLAHDPGEAADPG